MVGDDARATAEWGRGDGPTLRATGGAGAPRRGRSLAAALLLGAAVLALLAGCGREPPPAEGGDLLRDAGRHLVRIDAVSATDPAASLTFAVAARVSASGRHVVVLDVRPPFVKVFRREGGLRAAFLGEGRGPAEARGPTVLAVAGDSLVLVADSDGRLFTFDLDGRLLHHVPVLGIPVLAATAACDGEWLLYGPRFAAGGATARWLHRLPVGAGAEAMTSMLEGAPASADLAYGLAYGLVSTGGGALLRHDLGATPALVTWRCGAPSATVAPVPAETDPPAEAPVVKDGVAATRVRPGARMRGGVAIARGAVVRAEIVRGDPAAPYRTELTRFQGTATAVRSVPGIVTLRDSRPGVGVLVETEREDGHLVLVSESDFLVLFGAAPLPR